MSRESRKTRYRKQRSWIWYVVLFFAVFGSTGLFFYPTFSKKFLREKEKSEISQTRWLYWCAGSPEADDRPCYYVNREGLVVEGAPQLKGKLFPKLYDEREGEKRIEERLLSFVSHFYALGRFVVKNDDTLEIGWPGAMQLKVSLKDNPQEVAKNLALILEKEIGDRRDEVDYIDLRFGNRVYYKLKN